MKYTAYADEFGNNSFKFDTQGTHFIIATVIVKPDTIKILEEAVDDIRKKHKFQTGELKSNKVGPDTSRRIRILNDIVKLDFSIYAVVVDKRELEGKGFHYKKSFYKYLNNLLYKELFRTFPELELCVDEHGSNDYMLEFKKYVTKNHVKHLFSGIEFDIQDSKSSNLIQLADFIAGTLGHVYDATKKSNESNTFLKILQPKISSVRMFPQKYNFKNYDFSDIDDNFDPTIAEVSLRRINDFLDTAKGTEQKDTDQINFLKLLLIYQEAVYKPRYITTHEIFNHLNQTRDSNIKEEYFRTKVIGNLRDMGILIASSRKGYKIPTSKTDLESFIKHGNKIVMPMLSRIKNARETIKLATRNELDLLDSFPELKNIIDG